MIRRRGQGHITSWLLFMSAVVVTIFSNIMLGVSSVELTFELPDNAKECFHENIQKGVSSTFEFQVYFRNFSSPLSY